MMLSRTCITRLARRCAASSSFVNTRYASTLVVSEPLDATGSTPGQTQSTVTAAAQFGQPVELLVVGDQPPSQVPVGVSKVYHVPIGDRLAETVASAVQVVAESKDCSIVLGASTKFGSTIIPRAAALLDVAPITDILEIDDESTYDMIFIHILYIIYIIYLYPLFHSHPFPAIIVYYRYICSSHVRGKCLGKGSNQRSFQTQGLVGSTHQF
jgi:hypothetical protein